MQWRQLQRLWLVTVLLSGFAAASGAAEMDPRMQVDVSPEENESLDLPTAVNRAAATLWDRLLPRKVRDRLSEGNAMSLMMRATPDNGGYEIEFQPARVWQYLQAKQLPVLHREPAFNLQLRMFNEYGSRMQGSESALLEESRTQAERWGIRLDDQAPLLALTWRWLGPAQVQLNIRGNSRFPEQTETRNIDTADPVSTMQAWMQDVLLRARDAYAGPEENSATGSNATSSLDRAQLMVHIRRTSTLPEQVLIEEALRQDRRVQAMQPEYLSAEERQYSLRLTTTDDSWIPAWFSEHGMSATAKPYGWLVQ